MADGAASVVAAECTSCQKSRPEADGGPDDNVSLAPSDPEAPPTSVGCAQSIEPTEPRRKLRAWTWPGSHSQKAAGPDEGYPIMVVQCDYSSSTW